MAEEKKARRGLIIVHTGEGKGKTTAALGLALRACGHGLRVLMVQFLKGGWRTGELEAAKKLPALEILPMGKGFTWDSEDPEADRRAAGAAWERSRQAAREGTCDMLILDEVNYALDYGLVPLGEFLEFLRQKPPELHLILTGRNAKREVVELADLVTEMRSLKHPYGKGVKAQRGVEY